MTSFLAVLSGTLISVMILFNGTLADTYGSLYSTVLIHAIGLITIFLLSLLKKEPKANYKNVPWYFFLGGAIGVVTVVSNILAFPVIGVSLMVALGLLGQSGLSLIIDQFGLFGLEKTKLSKNRIIGLLIILVGAVIMIGG